MMQQHDRRSQTIGVVLGGLCFFLLVVPIGCLVLFSIGLSQDTEYQHELRLWLSGYAPGCGVVCSLLGLGMARKSKPLIIIGALGVVGTILYLVRFLS